MKNKNFFYQQYEKINWENQEKAKTNYLVNNFIIKQIIEKKKCPSIKIFDIGFGIGFFIRMLKSLNPTYKNIIIEGCEPSDKNYNYFIKKSLKFGKNVKIRTYNGTFQDVSSDEKFDFITAIYVFPHLAIDDLEQIAKKIHSMLNEKGKFILVVVNEKYLEEELRNKKDLFIEENIIEYNGKKYKEVLHYSDIPKIGKLIDCNREELFYINLFKENNFELSQKKDLNDSGSVSTVFVFEKSV